MREREKKKGAENVSYEINPNLKKETSIYPGPGSTVSNKVNPNRSKPRHILIKLEKIKDKKRILKARKEKQKFPYNGNPIRLSNDISAEMLWQKGVT